MLRPSLDLAISATVPFQVAVFNQPAKEGYHMSTHPLPQSLLPLETLLTRLTGVRKSLRGWIACCPAHDDRKPSLSIGLGQEGHILLTCFAGCTLERIVEAVGLSMADLFADARSSPASQAKQTHRSTLSLLDLAQDKMLPWQFLFHLGVTDERRGGVQILYHLPDGTVAPRYRWRTALVAKEGSRWSKGEGEIVAYGLERLEEARKAHYLVVVEGESDCWTLWYHHFPALGLPGAKMADKLQEAYLAGIDTLYIMQEPDAAGAAFVKAIERQLAAWQWPGKAYTVSLAGAKDPNDLHKQNWKGFKAAFQQALNGAEPLFITRSLSATRSTSPSKPSPISLQALLAKHLPPIRWAVPDILPEGLTLLAGKPKQGKSWLALSVALAIAAGGVALGKQPVTRGEVLYLALEDNERRLQARAKQLLACMTGVPTGMEVALSWPRLDQGGLTSLEDYLQAHPGVRLVVVDTWAKVSPQPASSLRSQYESDYAALSPLKDLADTYRLSILAIHHLRKLPANDILDEITGSIGVTGAVDGVLILKRERGEGEATLFVTGRDIEQEQQLALTFDALTAMWTLVGNAEEFKRTKERQEILDLLAEQRPEGMTPRQVAEALDKNYHTTRSLLRKMEDAGEVSHRNNAYCAMPADHAHHQCHQRHQCNQPVSLEQQREVVGQIEQRSPTSIDYVDYTDYTDYIDDGDDADESSSTCRRDLQEHGSSSGRISSQHLSAPEQTFKGTEDEPQYINQHGASVTSAINCHQRNQRNQCNQYAQPLGTPPQERLLLERTDGDIAYHSNDEHSEKEQHYPAVSKHRCPHHPQARWIRFDPSGQAWCDKMECWDCYRLMKIGEVLGYQLLLNQYSTAATIDQGIDAWASFVKAQSSFAIVTATEQAIALCEALGVEVPDLSGEVEQLVPV